MSELTGDDDEVRYALGAGLMLLVGVLTGVGLALLLSRTLGGTYITLLMPALTGWVVGAAVGLVARRFSITERLPVVSSALLGASIAYLGYQLIAYSMITDTLIEGLVGPIERATSDPAQTVFRWLEQQTGREGLMAYAAFLSDGRGAQISPLGIMARGGIGLTGTLALFGAELASALAASVLSATRRAGRGVRRAVAIGTSTGDAVRRFEVLSETDAEGVQALMTAIDSGDFEAAGRGLARPCATPSFLISFEWVPDTGRPYRLKIEALRDAGRRGELKAQRDIGALQAESLWDELKLARRRAGGGDSEPSGGEPSAPGRPGDDP